MQKLEFENTVQQSLFNAILQQKPNLNYQILNSVLRKKDVRVNGQKISQNIVVKPGDKITLFLPHKKQKQVDVVYQDQNILVVFKPQGMETTKADKVYLQTDCLEEVFDGCFACHRLDKNTEGLVVLAKNTAVRDLLFDSFKNHNIQKNYAAIAFGNVNLNGENFVDYHKKKNNKVQIFSLMQDGSSKILTSYKPENQNQNLWLLNIQIKTGKTHQIRAQLAHHGIYILGDERYGKKEINKQYKTKKQCLCACNLMFKNMPQQLNYLNNKTISVVPTFLKKYGF